MITIGNVLQMRKPYLVFQRKTVSCTKWKLLTKEKQQEYNETATRAESQTMSQKKEMRRVLSNLSNLVCKTIHLNSVLNVDAVCKLLYILYCLG